MAASAVALVLTPDPIAIQQSSASLRTRLSRTLPIVASQIPSRGRAWTSASSASLSAWSEIRVHDLRVPSGLTMPSVSFPAAKTSPMTARMTSTTPIAPTIRQALRQPLPPDFAGAGAQPTGGPPGAPGPVGPQPGACCGGVPQPPGGCCWAGAPQPGACCGGGSSAGRRCRRLLLGGSAPARGWLRGRLQLPRCRAGRRARAGPGWLGLRDRWARARLRRDGLSGAAGRRHGAAGAGAAAGGSAAAGQGAVGGSASTGHGVSGGAASVGQGAVASSASGSGLGWPQPGTGSRPGVSLDIDRSPLRSLLAGCIVRLRGPSLNADRARRARMSIGSGTSAGVALESGPPRRSSSVVEQGTHKPLVGGSNPPSATSRQQHARAPGPGRPTACHRRVPIGPRS